MSWRTSSLAGLVVAVNAFVLAGVAWNRGGEPDATLTLTERELPIARSAASSESSGVALAIHTWRWSPWVQRRPRPELDWLDAAKLAELGFDVALPEDRDRAADLVRRQLPRRCYAVLEYDGRAWESWTGRLAETIALLEGEVGEGRRSAADVASERRRAEQELRFGSRLFIVDAGVDPSVLRRRHPDRARSWIVPAKVSIQLDPAQAAADCRGPRCGLSGTVSLLLDEVSVPHRLQAALPKEAPRRWDSSGPREPRYEVVLRSGRRHEPWIEEIRPLAPTFSAPGAPRTPRPAGP